MKALNRFALAIASTIAISSFSIANAVTPEVEIDTFCRKFPFNSRCEDYKPTKTKSQTYQLNRDTFCHKFPLNSKCQQSLQAIELNLDRSGENDEWIRIEKQTNRIKLMHTTRVKDGLVSGALNGAIGALVPIPLPFIEANKYDWEDHRVVKVAFKSDSCQTNSCTITGTDSLTLPQGTNIYAGLFTISYQEKDLERSLSFRIPPDIKPETIDTVTVQIQH